MHFWVHGVGGLACWLLLLLCLEFNVCDDAETLFFFFFFFFFIFFFVFGRDVRRET